VVAERQQPAPKSKAEHVEAPAAPGTEAPTPTMRLTPHVVPTPAAPSPAPAAPAEPAKVAAEAPAAPVAAPAPAAPTAPKPPAAPGGRPHTPDGGIRAPVQRPTITLASKAAAGAPPAVRAQPFVPKPAQIQGPRVVREEKPDVVAA